MISDGDWKIPPLIFARAADRSLIDERVEGGRPGPGPAGKAYVGAATSGSIEAGGQLEEGGSQDHQRTIADFFRDVDEAFDQADTDEG